MIDPAQMTTGEAIEGACRGMYGKHWDGPLDKMPGPEMKEVWRKLALKAIEGAIVAITQDQRHAD